MLLQLIAEYGVAFVFVCVLIEQAGVPLPAFPVLMLTGALAARGQQHIAVLLPAAVAACLVADSAWYLAGQRQGRRVLRLLCRISLSPDGCVRQTEDVFSRWGAPSLMVAKFIPGFASIATALAGSIGVRPRAFLLFDAIGAALWAGAALLIGWLFAPAIEDVLGLLADWGRWGLGLVALALAAYVGAKWWQRRRFLRQLQMNRISAPALAQLMDAGDAPVIIDVRSAAAWQQARIPGSVVVQGDGWPAALLTLPLNTLVVVYCNCPNEASAVLFAKRMLLRGFKDVRPLDGGIDAWQAHGRALERVDDSA